MNTYVAIVVALALGIFCYLIIAGDLGQAGERGMDSLTTHTMEQKIP